MIKVRNEDQSSFLVIHNDSVKRGSEAGQEPVLADAATYLFLKRCHHLLSTNVCGAMETIFFVSFPTMFWTELRGGHH